MNSPGATKAQIAQHGWNWGLSSNSNDQDYYGYNRDLIQNDFEYIGVHSYLAHGIELDDKLYTYGYFHHGYAGSDPNGNTSNGTQVGNNGAISMGNDVPGTAMHNDYRSFGNILRLKKDVSFGDIQAGVWYDHQVNSRAQYEVDMSLSKTLNYANGFPIDRQMNDTLDTFQPFLQVDYKPLDNLTITPGIKLNWFQRHLDASVNQGTGTPLLTTATYEKATPSLVANYQINQNVSVYAQAAQGFLAPNLNILYTTNPKASHVNPQQSWNYQVGAVYRSERLTLSADAYFINFSNFIGSQTVAGVKEFFNDGGATYKGLEAEAAYYVGGGFTLYGNASVNSTRQHQTELRIPGVPDSTAAAGVIYNKDSVYASVIEKWVGAQYAGGAPIDNIDPYGVLNAAVAYTQKRGDGLSWLPVGTYRLTMENVLDQHAITGNDGTTADGSSGLYWTLPGRTIIASVSVNF